MNKKFLTMIFTLTLAGVMLMGCAAPMQASAAPAQMEELQQTASQVFASVLTDVQSRSGATPAAACPACGSDACTGDNCTGENAACREQRAVCTDCGSYDCDGGQLCTGRDTRCNPGVHAARHQTRHNTGHNGGHHGHHGE